MAKKLIVEVNGVRREMTKTQYDLIGFKRKPKIIGEAKTEQPQTEMDKLKADLIAKKEAGLPLNQVPEDVVKDVPRGTIVEQKPVEEPKKKSPSRPKSTPTE